MPCATAFLKYAALLPKHPLLLLDYTSGEGGKFSKSQILNIRKAKNGASAHPKWYAAGIDWEIFYASTEKPETLNL